MLCERENLLIYQRFYDGLSVIIPSTYVYGDHLKKYVCKRFYIANSKSIKNRYNAELTRE